MTCHLPKYSPYWSVTVLTTAALISRRASGPASCYLASRLARGGIMPHESVQVPVARVKHHVKLGSNADVRRWDEGAIDSSCPIPCRTRGAA